jgi:hypothetical protein
MECRRELHTVGADILARVDPKSLDPSPWDGWVSDDLRGISVLNRIRIVAKYKRRNEVHL